MMNVLERLREKLEALTRLRAARLRDLDKIDGAREVLEKLISEEEDGRHTTHQEQETSSHD